MKMKVEVSLKVNEDLEMEELRIHLKEVDPEVEFLLLRGFSQQEVEYYINKWIAQGVRQLDEE